MTTFYTFGARFSGIAAFVFAILSVLAYPGQVRADDVMTLCMSFCGPKGPGTQAFTDCMKDCQEKKGCSGTIDCSNGCSSSYKTGCDGSCSGSGSGKVCSGCECVEAVGLESCNCTF